MCAFEVDEDVDPYEVIYNLAKAKAEQLSLQIETAPEDSSVWAVIFVIAAISAVVAINMVVSISEVIY